MPVWADARMAGWRAWYADDRLFDSRVTGWRELPAEGVLGIVVYYEAAATDTPYRDIVTGGDWYYRGARNVPTCTATAEEWGEWVDPPDVPEAELKRAGVVDDDTYAAVQAAMMEARTWP